ncbi:uncharacterized protein B0H18DRAFT_866735 [Fomitopsis serialis]|uniref:uncharacterized protein n=1 Tax=Fomitopsis serialis TaxID=139415 RepID=UPI002007AA90|nr:uncharacterized protein B0H18DRAFT_866735 [Neoantrodia serialis]KAH9938008.1 hypothetical protein B0H18DRAFT_866735 [Neoantrodia serialis]
MSRFGPDALESSVLSGLPREGPPRLTLGATPETIEKYKAWFEKDSKKPPTTAPLVSPNLLVWDQERQRRAQEDENGAADGEMQTRLTVIGFPKHSSTKQLDQLKPITRSRMLMRKTHLGSYLICRSIAPCTKIVAIQTVVEDVNGDAQILSIYNFPTTVEASLKYLDLIFPVGVTMAILEPTFKAATQGEHPIIRVDSPTDIVFLDPRSAMLRDVRWKTGQAVPTFASWPSDADHWKAHGNMHFKAGHWLPAALSFSRGLQCDPESLVLRSNRSESYLRLKFYSAASADAHDVRCAAGVTPQLRDKASYREARAEYGRGRYQIAMSLFKQLRLSRPKDSDVVGWTSRCEQRLQESRTGNYDWMQLYKWSQTDSHLDIADYKGPIEVKQLPNCGGGRGVVATKEIHGGELLVVARPFSIACNGDLQSHGLQMTLNMLTSRWDRQTQSANVADAAKVVYGNPDLHDHVFHLYAGPNYPPPPPTYPPPPATELVELDVLAPRHRIDLAQLESICTHNNFGVAPLQPAALRPESSDLRDLNDTPTGLFLLPSLFNHSCAPNTLRIFIGNVMIIRASQMIKCGEEITLTYTSPRDTYSERRETLQRNWLMTCGCRQCRDDRADGEDNLRRRHAIVTALPRQLFMRPLTEIRSLEKQLSATYALTRGPCRPALADVHHSVAENLRSSYKTSDIKQAIEEDIKSLECYGWTVTDGKPGRRASYGTKPRKEELAVDTSHLCPLEHPPQSISHMLRIAQTYLGCNDMTKVAKWIKTAQWVFETSIGGGKELFMTIERRTLEQFELLDVAAAVL